MRQPASACGPPGHRYCPRVGLNCADRRWPTFWQVAAKGKDFTAGTKGPEAAAVADSKAVVYLIDPEVRSCGGPQGRHVLQRACARPAAYFIRVCSSQDGCTNQHVSHLKLNAVAYPGRAEGCRQPRAPCRDAIMTQYVNC